MQSRFGASRKKKNSVASPTLRTMQTPFTEVPKKKIKKKANGNRRKKCIFKKKSGKKKKKKEKKKCNMQRILWVGCCADSDDLEKH